VGACGFEGCEVSVGVVERADRSELGPPGRRHGHQTLEAPRPVASDEVVEEGQCLEAGGRDVEQAGQPWGHVLEGAAAVGLDAERGEHRDMEIVRVPSMRERQTHV
jgi:hypothetical protein